MFIILNWWYDEIVTNALPVTDKNGTNLTFHTKKEAEDYAKKKEFEWKL